MTPAGLTRLRLDECVNGIPRLFVYNDANAVDILPGSLHPAGNPTIGFGRNLSGRGITPTEAFYMLNNDVTAIEAEISAAYPWMMPLIGTVRGDVITMVSFNSGSLSLWPRLMSAAQAARWMDAAGELMNSLVGRGAGKSRYTRMHNAMIANAWPNGTIA